MITDVYCAIDCGCCEYIKLERSGEFICPDKKRIHIQSTSFCNARCKCCHKSHTDQHSMPDEYWFKFLDEIKKLKTPPIIQFGILDEPLCDITLIEKIKQVKLCGVDDVVILTNSSLLDNKAVNSLIDAGVTHFIFSLLSPLKNEFTALTGLNFDTVVGNINNAIGVCNKRGIWYLVSASVYNESRNKFVFELFPQNTRIGLSIQDNRSGLTRWAKSPNFPDNCPCIKSYLKYNLNVDGSFDYYYDGSSRLVNIMDANLCDIFEMQKNLGRL